MTEKRGIMWGSLGSQFDNVGPNITPESGLNMPPIDFPLFRSEAPSVDKLHDESQNN
jgi:hypothetical protein